MKEDKEKRQAENEQKKIHPDDKLNRQMAQQFVDYWEPKIGDKVQIRIFSSRFSFSWHIGKSLYPMCVDFDMSNEDFKAQVNFIIFKKTGVMIKTTGKP